MRGRISHATLVVLASLPISAQDADLLNRFRQSLRSQLRQMPDFTCLETIERARRAPTKTGFDPVDTIRVQVGVIAGREHYAWPGAKSFETTELRNLVPTGAIGTGSFADHVQHIFLNSRTEFAAQGADPLGERFTFELPAEFSQYRLRAATVDIETGVMGAFWVNAETLALVRLEVGADEISPDTGISRMQHWINFAPVTLAAREAVLPVASELTLVTANGLEEFRNTMEFAGCQAYRAESKLIFDEDPAPTTDTASAATAPRLLPAGARVDLSLETEIDPERAALGDTVTAVVAKPVREADQVVVAAGTRVLGRLTRIEKEAVPFRHYVVGLEFHTLEAAGAQVEFAATMHDAGPSSALLRPQKKFMPAFAPVKQRTNKMNILVREIARGEGVLHWDARHPKIRRGLRMVWITSETRAGR
jgi:hypothetical protein